MRYNEKMKPLGNNQFHMDMGMMNHEHSFPLSHGRVFMDLTWPDGTLIEHRDEENLIVYDAGILIARLLKNSLVPVLGRSNGINMLAVGTGAVGDLLNPDAPVPEQRQLVQELFRKVVTAQYRTDPGGVAVSYPTHVVDFSTTFGEGEANGPLNEMGLLSAFDLTEPSPGNPINNGPGTPSPTYDPTIDVTNKDIFGNYLPFPVVSKPVGSILAITWRFTV
ncbi:MAG: hypothetical protein WCO84_07965 [bacterium]